MQVSSPINGLALNPKTGKVPQAGEKFAIYSRSPGDAIWKFEGESELALDPMTVKLKGAYNITHLSFWLTGWLEDGNTNYSVILKNTLKSEQFRVSMHVFPLGFESTYRLSISSKWSSDSCIQFGAVPKGYDMRFIVYKKDNNKEIQITSLDVKRNETKDLTSGVKVFEIEIGDLVAGFSGTLTVTNADEGLPMRYRVVSYPAGFDRIDSTKILIDNSLSSITMNLGYISNKHDLEIVITSEPINFGSLLPSKVLGSVRMTSGELKTAGSALSFTINADRDSIAAGKVLVLIKGNPNQIHLQVTATAQIPDSTPVSKSWTIDNGYSLYIVPLPTYCPVSFQVLVKCPACTEEEALLCGKVEKTAVEMATIGYDGKDTILIDVENLPEMYKPTIKISSAASGQPLRLIAGLYDGQTPKGSFTIDLFGERSTILPFIPRSYDLKISVVTYPYMMDIRTQKEIASDTIAALELGTLPDGASITIDAQETSSLFCRPVVNVNGAVPGAELWLKLSVYPEGKSKGDPITHLKRLGLSEVNTTLSSDFYDGIPNWCDIEFEILAQGGLNLQTVYNLDKMVYGTSGIVTLKDCFWEQKELKIDLVSKELPVCRPHLVLDGANSIIHTLQVDAIVYTDSFSSSQGQQTLAATISLTLNNVPQKLQYHVPCFLSSRSQWYFSQGDSRDIDNG